MGHPDQQPPDAHRSSTDQSAPKPDADQNLQDDLSDPALQDDADTGSGVRTPEPEEPRQGEAGHSYVGRQMDDRMKTNPRIDDADEVTSDEG